MSIPSARALNDGMADARWSTADLWLASVGVGGSFTTSQVAELTSGHRDATATEHDILAAALNDHLTGLERNHPVPYWYQLPAS